MTYKNNVEKKIFFKSQVVSYKKDKKTSLNEITTKLEVSKAPQEQQSSVKTSAALP